MDKVRAKYDWQIEPPSGLARSLRNEMSELTQPTTQKASGTMLEFSIYGMISKKIVSKQ